jgi:hypothetical protein
VTGKVNKSETKEANDQEQTPGICERHAEYQETVPVRSKNRREGGGRGDGSRDLDNSANEFLDTKKKTTKTYSDSKAALTFASDRSPTDCFTLIS